MTAPALAPPEYDQPARRIAPGIVTTENSPIVLMVRPLLDEQGVPVPKVWAALIDDRDGKPPKLIHTEGPAVIQFITDCCVHTQARWTGKPFDLLPWQKYLIVELFELVWSDTRGRWVRRYHEALIGTPKKNGKSDLLAAIGLYLLVEAGEPSPIVVAAAANETSALLVYTPAKTMVELSGGARKPGYLADKCNAWGDEIHLRGARNAFMRKVPASPKATEGLNIYCNLCDEWHEWTGPAAEQTATKLFNGTVLRPDFLNLRTTTAGHDIESMCGLDYEFGKQVADGDVEAPEWFFRWWEAPREIEVDGALVPLDWRSETAVRLANPSYGVLAQWEFYEQKLRREPEGSYRRYFLNQWTDSENAWLPVGAWEGCETDALNLVAGAPTSVGWDASTKNDSTAVVVAQRQGERIVLRAWIWERPIDPQTRKPIDDWLIPIEEVRAVITWIVASFRPSSIEYDPAFISWEAAAMKDAGFPMREFSQSSVSKMVQAAQGFYERVVNGIVAWRATAEKLPTVEAKSPVALRWATRVFTRHIRSAVARQTSSGSAGFLLTKGKARRKMDATVAAAMAIWGLEHPDPEKPKRKAPNLHVRGDRDG